MRHRTFAAKRIAAILMSASLAAPVLAERLDDPFRACARFSGADLGRELARCIYEAARTDGSWDTARRQLEELGTRHPDDPWPRLYLGHVSYFGSPQDAGDSYREAILVAERTSPEAGVEARIGLVRVLSQDGRLDEADGVLGEALEIAELHGDRRLLARVRIREASQHAYQGRHLDLAHHLLQQIEEDVFPDGPADLRKEWLNTMVRVSDVLGRQDDVRSALGRSLTLAEELGDLTAAAWAKYAIAAHYVSAELPTPETRERAHDLYREALAAARAAAHPRVESLVRLELGKLVGGDEARRHFEACLEIAATPLLTNFCEGAFAASLLPADAGQARLRIEEVMAAAASSPDPWLMVYGWEERLPVLWETLSSEEALRRSVDLLGSLETLRESQVSGAARAGLLAARAGPYYWLSGRLLEDAGEPRQRRRNLEQAFAVIERMRARVLLEVLEASRTARLPKADEDESRELAEVLGRKVDIQRRLLDPRLTPAARADAIAELRHVESDEAAVRHRIAEAYPGYATLRPRDFATLGALEAALDDGEALLSFQLAFDEDVYGRFGGGSWLVVSTRAGTRYYRLPDRVRLESRLRVLARLTDPSLAKTGLTWLYEALLAAALDDLPEGVDRLVIVPDEGLHRLPFALLRSAADAEPVIARYRLSIVPSATLWLRWRDLGTAPGHGKPRPPAADEAPVLVFADPLIEGHGQPATGAPTRQGSLGDPLALAPLPYARDEGRTIVRLLGGESRLLVGPEASERFLKTADLQRFGILHFAAHAVINDEVPERSAVVLAAGDDHQDGWLQPREIADLDLDGRLVVLASCDTAAGQVLRGEGVMSLARAFFYAGAPAVVASLWPLPDRESAQLFEELYRRLSDGDSVDAALAGAQRSRRRAGAPARAWAGVLVLGDGESVPFPEGRLPGSRFPGSLWLIGLAVMLLVAAFWLWTVRRRTGSAD